ncbi:hypothetical protein RHGRI_009195 [Rhododendron griersonianum]|uniref:Uncharacterized protein n=1 Tax=Rhododendron griersonianum TaxID=479676 RepID=A0AAV6L4G4_9ERIC|nr:hypothetical protein RHGRI_009195 [Rhododendron griersonianum]
MFVDSWVRLRETEARRRHGRVPSVRRLSFGKPRHEMRHRRVPSVRRFGFGKPRYEGSTEGFRRFVGLASGNRGTKEARKGSVDSWVWFKKTKARMRHGRVPSVRRFEFGKPRYERSTEGFRRFVGLVSGNRDTKEARKGSIDSWVWFKKTKARMIHGRVPSVRRFGFGKPRFGFGKPRYEGSTEGFRRFVGSASGNRGTKEARKGSVDSWVWFKKTKARMRHGRVPSVRRFGFGKPRFSFEKPRYEGSTEGFRRFVGSALGNRGTKEARKGSVNSWVWFKKTKARMRHGRVPSVRRFGFGKPRYKGSTEVFRRFAGSASGNRGTKEARKGSVVS